MVKITIAVTVDPDLNDSLVEEADKQKRSKSSMVNWILTKYFEDKPN